MKNATTKSMDRSIASAGVGGPAFVALMLAALLMTFFLSVTPAKATSTCVDPTLQTDLVSGTAAYTNAAIVNTRTVFEASPRSDIRKTQCLGSGFFNYFDLIRAILSGINAMVVLINSIVASILRAICDYINNAISNLINTALSLLCIPTLPGLNFGLSLGGLGGRSSCSGAPLFTFGGGGALGSPGGAPTFFNNMSRGIPGSGGFRF